jgi:hypothetical protein
LAIKEERAAGAALDTNPSVGRLLEYIYIYIFASFDIVRKDKKNPSSP